MSKITFGKEIDMIALASPIQGSTVIAYHSGGGGFAKGALLQKNSSGVLSYVGGVELSGKEDVANKQNSLAIDGTGTKYYTVDYINTLDSNLLHKTGDETKTGTLKLGNGTFSADDSSLLINRSLTTGGTSTGFHALRDETLYDTNDITGLRAYASFDAIPVMKGTAHFNHLHAFQARPDFSGSDIVDAVRGFTFQGTYNGNVDYSQALYIDDYIGSGTVNQNIGLWIRPLTKGVSNFAIFTEGTTPSFLGGNVESNGIFRGTGVRIDGFGTNYGSIPSFDSSGNFLDNPNLTIVNGILDMRFTTAKIFASATDLKLESIYGIQFYTGGSGASKKAEIDYNGNLFLIKPPTSSAGTYDVLTRNTTSGEVEKVSSSTFATTASELTVTPAVNGLSNAQAVLTDHETRIDTLETSSSGTTNLTTTQSSTTVTVNSDTGTDATIVLANGTNAGVSTNDYTTAEKSKLTGIATGATVNSSDATLLDRANHTGTQTASTISDFNTSVDSRIASSSPDLSFLNVAYASTITRAYDNLRPNLEIDITGNLDFTLTDTSSGESGLLNLYFSGTETATLQGVTDLVVTGTGEMIPVYFVHDSDGIKWYKDEVGGATVDTSLFALKNGTILYHTLPRFTPTGTISTVGVNITISTGQFTSTMVGQKLTINGEERIIATYISATSVTVDTAYGTNYVSVSSANWDVYNKAVEVDSIGGIQIRSNVNTSILDALSNSNMTVGNSVVGSGAGWELKSAGIVLKSTGVLVHSSTGFQTGTPDVGLRRNSPKVYEVYDGVTNTGLEANRGDLLVRNLISKSNVYTDDATADADTSLPSGAFYKITGSRVIYQKP